MARHRRREHDERPKRERMKPWPFAHEVIPRSVLRDELIARQYAHLPPKVVW